MLVVFAKMKEYICGWSEVSRIDKMIVRVVEKSRKREER